MIFAVQSTLLLLIFEKRNIKSIKSSINVFVIPSKTNIVWMQMSKNVNQIKI